MLLQENIPLVRRDAETLGKYDREKQNNPPPPTHAPPIQDQASSRKPEPKKGVFRHKYKTTDGELRVG